MTPQKLKLNVGGTRYEVSDALLDRFQNSMLRKITSGRCNQNDDDDDDSDDTKEIFIERDGGRFQIILEYMTNGKVVLPLSIPRLQLIRDMEYYGIDFDESQIILDVAVDDDSNDVFRNFSEFFHEKRRFKNALEPKRKALDIRYRGLAAESMSCKVASKFFEQIFSDRSSSTFECKEIRIGLSKEPIDDLSINDLQPYLNQYGLQCCDVKIDYSKDYSENEIIIRVENRKIYTANTIRTKEEEIKSAVCEEAPTKKRKMIMMPKQILLNVGGTRYEVSNSLLDRFQDSMLRKITSDAIMRSGNKELSDPGQNEEICIKRDGCTFKFVLDYMRDGEVVLPLSVYRPQFVSDMKYYGIGFDESQITLNVADPNDTFHKLSEYYYKTEQFKKKFESALKDIDIRYRALAAERVSCEIASEYFEEQVSDMSSFSFGTKIIRRLLRRKEKFHYSIEELQSHLHLYGLDGFDLEQRDKTVTKSKDFWGHDTEATTYRRVDEPTCIALKVKML